MLIKIDSERKLASEKMVEKKKESRMQILLTLVFLAFFIATYNALTLFMNLRNMKSRELFDLSHSRPKFHVAVTATATSYSQWQCRIMYHWYKKAKDKDNSDSDMGKFTRILHSGTSDRLINEIPTFVVKPLPTGVDQGYVVLNRPWAFVQWLELAYIEEEYILMAEPDHIIVKPIPNLAHGGNPAAYSFFYIVPESHEALLRKFYPAEKGPISNIDPIGNSPVIIKKSTLKEIGPTWTRVSIDMKNDEETNREFGWVLEMYAYAVASALHGLRHSLHMDFMIQPPFDKELGNAMMIHYTYPCDYNAKGELTYNVAGAWQFDKRSFIGRLPPRNISFPPPGAPQSVIQLVAMLNDAAASIPDWNLSSLYNFP